MFVVLIANVKSFLGIYYNHKMLRIYYKEKKYAAFSVLSKNCYLFDISLDIFPLLDNLWKCLCIYEFLLNIKELICDNLHVLELQL